MQGEIDPNGQWSVPKSSLSSNDLFGLKLSTDFNNKGRPSLCFLWRTERFVVGNRKNSVEKSVENTGNIHQMAVPADTSVRIPFQECPLELLIHRKSVN
jgi:hypothetical protein